MSQEFYQNNKSCAMFINVSYVLSPRDLPVDQSASFVDRNAAARFEPTSLKVGRIHSRHCRWRYGATPPEALEELQSGLGSTVDQQGQR